MHDAVLHLVPVLTALAVLTLPEAVPGTSCGVDSSGNNARSQTRVSLHVTIASPPCALPARQGATRPAGGATRARWHGRCSDTSYLRSSHACPTASGRCGSCRSGARCSRRTAGGFGPGLYGRGLALDAAGAAGRAYTSSRRTAGGSNPGLQVEGCPGRCGSCRLGAHPSSRKAGRLGLGR